MSNYEEIDNENSVVDTDEDSSEIEFEDNIDIDKIQEKIEQFDEKPAQNADSQANEGTDKNIYENVPPTVFESPKINTGSKKYVIYVDPENVDFIENLSIPERKKIVNEILREQDKAIKRQNQIKARIKFIKHLLVACLTIIIAFPFMYYFINKMLLLSITNYKQTQQSFEKLYKEKGKIDAYKNIQNY